MRQRLPALALAGLLVLGGAGALAQAEAERRLDAAIERLRAALGPDGRLEIGQRRVDPVSGRAVLTDVILVQGPNALTLPEIVLTEVSESRIGRAEANRPSYRDTSGGTGEAARVLVAGLPLPPPGAALDLSNLVFEAVEAEALRMDGPQGALRLGRAALRDWRPERIGGGTVEGFEFRGAGPDVPMMRLGRAAVEQLVLPLTRGEFDPLAFRADRLAIEGAELRDTTQPVTASLGRLAVSDWVPGRRTEFALEGLQMAGPGGQLGALEMRVGRVSSTGVDLAGLAQAVATKVQVPDPEPGVQMRVAIEGVDMRADGRPMLAIGRLASDGLLENGTMRGATVAEGLRIALPPGQGAFLAELGYQDVAGGFEMRASMPRTGGRLEIAPIAITWETAASLVLTGRVEGMPAPPPPGAPVDPNDALAQYAAARLLGLTLTLRDHGLLGRVLAVQARQQRMPEARLREQWAQMALAMPLPGAPPAGRGAPPAKGAAADPFVPVREALARFIRQPGTLEITLAPPKAILFTDIAGLAGEGPQQIVQRLGLSVVAR
jgi:hypothetical protein